MEISYQMPLATVIQPTQLSTGKYIDLKRPLIAWQPKEKVAGDKTKVEACSHKNSINVQRGSQGTNV